MKVESVTNNWSVIDNQYRHLQFKTLVDPVTDKKVLEVVDYLYDKSGKVEPTNIGRNVDRTA